MSELGCVMYLAYDKYDECGAPASYAMTAVCQRCKAGDGMEPEPYCARCVAAARLGRRCWACRGGEVEIVSIETLVLA